MQIGVKFRHSPFVGTGENNAEHIAVELIDHKFRRQKIFDSPRQPPHKFVADNAIVRVVNRLEIIRAQQNHRAAFARFIDGTEHRPQRMLKAVFVQQTRYFIGLVTYRHAQNHSGENRRAVNFVNAYAPAHANPNVIALSVFYAKFKGMIVNVVFFANLFCRRDESVVIVGVDKRHPYILVAGEHFAGQAEILHDVGRKHYRVALQIVAKKIGIGGVL